MANDAALQEKISGIISASKNTRAFYEPKWYVNYNAYENNHFTVWLPESKQIKKVPIRGNKFFNQIPEIKKQVDTIQNMILSPELVPIVYPVNMDDASTYWAKKIGDYLMYLYKHWMFLGVLHDAVHDALVQPVSYFQLLPPETNDGKMDIIELDAFDVFVPRGIKDVQAKNCNYVGKSIRHPIDEIHANKNYNSNRLKVKGSEKSSSSDYKDILEQERYAQTGSESQAMKTAVVDEVWIKERQNDGKTRVRVITTCENMILRDELTSYDRLPFVSLKLHQGVLYQPSFVEYLLPINRSIDLSNSRLEDLSLKLVRGALLAAYGSNITRTTNENGEIIYYRGQQPEYLNPPEVPPFFINYINTNFSLMERYGASAVTMGASPKGMKTYRTVEAVRQQDYAALKTPMDFMKIALTQLFNLVIYFASMYYLEPVGVKIYEQENYNVFDVIGSEGLEMNMHLFENAQQQGGQEPYKNAPVVVHKDNVVEVEFESAQSYTMEGKRQTVFEAVKAGLLDKEDAIRMLKLGNVRDIIENLEKESVKDMKAQAVKQAMIQKGNGAGAQPQPGAGAPSELPNPAQNLGETPNAQPGPGTQGIRVGQ